MNAVKEQPKLHKPLKGVYRVCETNPIYECGWIFVSNELDIDDALDLQAKYEKERPHLTYSIVAL